MSNLGGTLNFLLEIINRTGEQAEKLPEFPIVPSEKFAPVKQISAQLGGRLHYHPSPMLIFSCR